MSAAEQLADPPSLPTGQEEVKAEEYLSDVSPRHKPWDVHRAEADDPQRV